MAGCSTDTAEAQKAFADKLGGLRFPLIADRDAAIAKAFDVYLEDWKTAARATALIDEQGIVRKTWPRAPLDGKAHAEEVFGEVSKLLA